MSYWWEFTHRTPFLDSGPLWFVEVLLYVSVGYAAWSWAAERLRHRLTVAPAPLGGAYLLAVAVAMMLASFAVRNGDFWMHLAAGRDLVHGQYQPWLGHDPYAVRASRYQVGRAFPSQGESRSPSVSGVTETTSHAGPNAPCTSSGVTPRGPSPSRRG